MRRGIFVSSLLIAGSTLCVPAFARTQDKLAETPAPSAAKGPMAAIPAKPEPLLATPNGQVMDKARELAEADLTAAPDEEIKPLRVDPNQASKRGFALAKATPRPATEEQPALAERAPEAGPAVAVARSEPRPAIEAEARPALAEAEPAPAPLPGITGEQPALAEQETESEQRRGGGDPVVMPVYAQRRYEAADEPVAEAERGDPVVRPTYRQRRWEPKPIERAERTPAAEPRVAEDDGRPDYVEAERIVRAANAAPPPVATEAAAPVAEAARADAARPIAKPVQSAEAAPVESAPQVADAADEAGDGAREVLRDASRAARVVRQAGRVARVLGGAAVGAAADAPVLADDEEREEQPVYAEEERDTEQTYPRERREAPVYAEEEREEREAPVYAEARRDYPPVYADERPLRQRVDYRARFSNRMAPDSCDSHRYEGLSRAVRRAAEVGSIDWRTARDMDDEIAHGEAMQRSYCQSGMNDWRERRLDDQYAQIEDRLRLERGRFR